RAPLLCVLDRMLERRAADPERVRRELDARPVEDPHQAGEAPAFVAEAPVLWDEAVLEVQFTRREAAAAHRRQPRAPPDAPVPLGPAAQASRAAVASAVSARRSRARGSARRRSLPAGSPT